MRASVAAIIGLIIGLIIALPIGYFAFLPGAPATTTVTTTVEKTVTSTVTVTSPVTTTPPPTTPPPTTPPTTPPPTTPPPAKQIVIGVTDKVTDLDPSNAYDFFTWEVLNNVMEGLVKYKPGTDQIIPALAESYEIKEDGKVWVFKLRDGLKFADGTPCKAQDVVRSIKRVMKINGDPAWLVTSFVEDVTAEDDLTVVFTLSKPVSYFLALVATPPYFPVHPAYKPEEIDSDQTAGGCGAYKIEKFVRDQELVLVANPYYYGEKPKTERIVIKFFRDAATMRLALEAGEIDIAWRTLRPTDIADLSKNPNFNVVEVPGSYIRYVVVRVNQPPTDNKLVRQALAAALNRAEIAKIVFMNTVEPLFSMVPKGLWSHIDVFKDKYGDGNIELAKKLLTQAGYSEENKLKVELWYTPTHYGDTEADMAQLIKQQWERTGMIEVELKSAEWSTYVDYLRKGTMMLNLLGWYPDYIDPDDYLTPFLHSEANKWTGTGYENSKVNELLDKAALLTDQSQRADLYKQVQEILADECPFIPIIQGKLFVVTKKGISGVTIGPTMLFIYSTVYWSG